jgi:hypothetical protein
LSGAARRHRDGDVMRREARGGPVLSDPMTNYCIAQMVRAAAGIKPERKKKTPARRPAFSAYRTGDVIKTKRRRGPAF